MSLMFDKIIKVELISSGSFKYSSYELIDVEEIISTPEKGRKPLISVKGKMTGLTSIQDIELKITNLYTNKLFSDYKAVKITAGYKNGEQAEIYGSIMNAYIETPPPDSVTVFEVLLGDLNKWSTAWINKNYEKNTTVQSIFSDFADLLELDSNWKITTVLSLNSVMNFNCLVQDGIFKLKKAFPSLLVRPDYKELNVCDEIEGTQRTYKLDYIRSAKKDSAGFTIVAPWNPAIRPMDTVELNPLYFKQSYGGQNISGTEFNVITLDFEFNTKNINTMNLVTVEKPKK